MGARQIAVLLALALALGACTAALLMTGPGPGPGPQRPSESDLAEERAVAALRAAISDWEASGGMV
jgi:hypothetical protein